MLSFRFVRFLTSVLFSLIGFLGWNPGPLEICSELMTKRVNQTVAFPTSASAVASVASVVTPTGLLPFSVASWAQGRAGQRLAHVAVVARALVSVAQERQ